MVKFTLLINLFPPSYSRKQLIVQNFLNCLSSPLPNLLICLTMPRTKGLRTHNGSSDEESANSDSSEEYNKKKKSSNARKKMPSSQSHLSQRSSGSQSQSQLSQTQQDLSQSELHRLGAICANYFLVANCKKIPIKRQDIGKLVPKEYTRKLGNIIDDASLKLEEVFGYKVVQLEKKGSYLLVNLLDLSSIFKGSLPIDFQPHESAIIVIRTNILTTILMSGGVITDSTLREYLRKFDVDIESKENHPLLGNVQKLVYQDFVRQGYLEVEDHKDMEIPFKDLRWGSRSKEELDKKELIQFVCKIYGESIQPEMWIEQWRSANEEAGNNRPSR